MKKIIFVVLTIISFQLQAQSYDINYQEPDPKFYIGLQSGLESFAGLIGITADYRIAGNFFEDCCRNSNATTTSPLWQPAVLYARELPGRG